MLSRFPRPFGCVWTSMYTNHPLLCIVVHCILFWGPAAISRYTHRSKVPTLLDTPNTPTRIWTPLFPMYPVAGQYWWAIPANKLHTNPKSDHVITKKKTWCIYASLPRTFKNSCVFFRGGASCCHWILSSKQPEAGQWHLRPPRFATKPARRTPRKQWTPAIFAKGCSSSGKHIHRTKRPSSLGWYLPSTFFQEN